MRHPRSRRLRNAKGTGRVQPHLGLSGLHPIRGDRGSLVTSEAPPQTDEESRRGDACGRPCRRTHGVGLPRRASARPAGALGSPLRVSCRPLSARTRPRSKCNLRVNISAAQGIQRGFASDRRAARSATVMANGRRGRPCGVPCRSNRSRRGGKQGRPQGSPLRVSGPALRPKSWPLQKLGSTVTMDASQER